MVQAQGYEISSEVMVAHLRIWIWVLHAAKAPPGTKSALPRADQQRTDLHSKACRRRKMYR